MTIVPMGVRRIIRLMAAISFAIALFSNLPVCIILGVQHKNLCVESSQSYKYEIKNAHSWTFEKFTHSKSGNYCLFSSLDVKFNKIFSSVLADGYAKQVEFAQALHF